LHWRPLIRANYFSRLSSYLLFTNHNVALHGSRLVNEKYKDSKVFFNETDNGVKQIRLV